jgi:hypothetical protein
VSATPNLSTRVLGRPAALALALFFAAAIALMLLGSASPRAKGRDAPTAEFSCLRALDHLAVIAEVPHPWGSPANEHVRGFLEWELTSLGIAWETQVWTAPQGYTNAGGGREGVNLLARIPARHGERGRASVLSVVHYDSHPAAPGAGDDGAAVAAVLECLRALSREAPPQNELLFLFTDGEEYGLLGAQAFAADPERLEGVAVVLNFEARGNAGPVILFETGRDDRAWIEAYAACATRPLASSLGPSIYERMPNDTDFTVFKRLGLPGLNFAFIGGGTAYHRPADTPENVSWRALQHHGETLLALARHLGNADLSALGARRGRATYFTLHGNLFVHYPASWDWTVVLAAALCVAGALAAGLRAGVLRVPSTVLGALATPVAVALLAGALAAVGLGVRAVVLALGPSSTSAGNGGSSMVLLAGATACAVVLATLAVRRLPAAWLDGLALGTLVLWTVLAAISAAWLPGASHIFAWPALCGALGLHAALHLRRASGARAAGHLVLWGSALISLALTLPVLRLIHQVGAIEPARGLSIAALLLALGSGLFLPGLTCLAAALPRWLAPLAGLGALALLVLGGWLEAAGH